MPEHPKIAAAGPLALAMQVAGLCYCNRELTDGFIPRAKARTLLDWEIVRPDGSCYAIGIASGMAGQDVSSDWVIGILVESGMWDEVPGGYRIHDYLDYQPTRAEVEATQQIKSEAGKKGAHSRWHGRGKAEAIAPAKAEAIAPVMADAMANEWQNDAPKPKPKPFLGDKSPLSPPLADGERESTAPRYTPEFDEFWSAFPRGHGTKKTAFAQWQRLTRAERQQLPAALERWKVCERWQQGYVKAAEMWIRDRLWEQDPPPAKPRAPNGTSRTRDQPDFAQMARDMRERETEQWT